MIAPLALLCCTEIWLLSNVTAIYGIHELVIAVSSFSAHDASALIRSVHKFDLCAVTYAGLCMTLTCAR